MSYAINQQELPIREDVIITVFTHGVVSSFILSKEGTMLSSKNSIATEFRNRYRHHQLISGGNQNTFEKKITAFLKSISHPVETTGTEAFSTYLKSQGYPEINPSTQCISVIIPRPDKAYSGDFFNNTFRLVGHSFLPNSWCNDTLPVYMTKITPEITEIKFRVDVPDYIYEKCMQDSDVEKRPPLKYIEATSLGILHAEMDRLSSQAVHVFEMQKSSQNSTKMIGIVFQSNESSKRDDYNHAYLGQNIGIKFNWYIIHRFKSINFSNRNFSYYSWHKMVSAGATTFQKNGGISGIIDMESKGKKCFIHGTPPGVLVEWTQEREDFFKRLEEGFRGLSSNLNKFLADLDAEKIDLLISNNSLLKLTQ